MSPSSAASRVGSIGTKDCARRSIARGRSTRPASPRTSLRRIGPLPLPEIERARALTALTRTQADQPFDLTRAPLLRLRLVRQAPEVHTLILTISHLVADGWSFGVLLHELKIAYAAGLEDRPPGLEPALQFSRYRALLDTPEVRASVARSNPTGASASPRFPQP